MITELSAPGRYVLRAARGFDVLKGEVVPNAGLLVEGDSIREFASGLAAPVGATVIDLGDSTLLPGLHDNHCHLMIEPRDLTALVYKRSSARKALDGLLNAQQTLFAGFTTVRDPGDCDWQYGLVDLRNFINQGHAAGPRILVAPHFLSITGGHGDANDFACDLCMRGLGKIVDGVEAMRQAVREEIKYGADWIKLFASGGVVSMGDNPEHSHYSREEIRIAAEEAHRLGKKITAHAHGAEAIRMCAESGFDSVEHCTLIDDEGLRLMKERGVYCVPTLYVLDFVLRPENPMNLDASIIEKARTIGKHQRERFARIVELGVPVAYGTDSGLFPHGENWRDFPCMVECGMAPIEAIRAATIDSARMNGIADRVGAFAPGLAADVIAVPVGSGPPVQVEGGQPELVLHPASRDRDAFTDDRGAEVQDEVERVGEQVGAFARPARLGIPVDGMLRVSERRFRADRPGRRDLGRRGQVRLCVDVGGKQSNGEQATDHGLSSWETCRSCQTRVARASLPAAVEHLRCCRVQRAGMASCLPLLQFMPSWRRSSRSVPYFPPHPGLPGALA